MNRLKLIQTIVNLLRLHNNCLHHDYIFVHRYSNQQLQQMLVGWQQNQPKLFNTHGLYIL